MKVEIQSQQLEAAQNCEQREVEIKLHSCPLRRIWVNPAPTFAKPHSNALLSPGTGAHNHLIPVLKETALLAGCKPERIVPAARRLEQTAEAASLRRGDRARPEQVSWLQVAATAGVVGDELRDGPIHVSRAAERHTVRRQTLLPQTRRDEKYFQIELKHSLPLIAIIQKVRQRLWVGFRPRSLRHAERSKRLRSHYPGRDGRREILRQERTERLILPGLDVTGRPVVEKTEARHLLFGLGDRNRVAEGVARPDKLELIVEPLARTEARPRGVRRL